MKILIVDYSGTLTRVSNPVEFVNALKEQGWFVVLWTATLEGQIERQHPGLIDAVDWFASKPDLPRERIKETATEVVLVDDEPYMEGIARALQGYVKRPCRFLPAENIETLL